jgi:hypothetical protein
LGYVDGTLNKCIDHWVYRAVSAGVWWPMYYVLCTMYYVRSVQELALSPIVLVVKRTKHVKCLEINQSEIMQFNAYTPYNLTSMTFIDGANFGFDLFMDFCSATSHRQSLPGGGVANIMQ